MSVPTAASLTTTRRMTVNYLLERRTEEYQRLLQQAALWQAPTSLALDQLGSLAGRRVLDVGCGPGSLWPELAARIGSRGVLTGVDTDGPALIHARERLAGRENLPQLRTLQCAAADLPEREGACHDVVLARLFLFHQPDPLLSLRQLADCLRPGGALLLLDFDCSACCALDGDELIARAMDLANRAFVAAGLDPRRGSRLPQLLLDAGLGSAHWVDCAGLMLPRNSGVGLLRSLLGSLAGPIQGHGLASAEALQQLDIQLRTLGSRGGPVRVPDQVAVLWRAPR